MKKVFAFLLVGASLSLFSCGGGETAEGTDSTSVDSTEAAVVEPAEVVETEAPADTTAAAAADSAATEAVVDGHAG